MRKDQSKTLTSLTNLLIMTLCLAARWGVGYWEYTLVKSASSRGWEGRSVLTHLLVEECVVLCVYVPCSVFMQEVTV